MTANLPTNQNCPRCNGTKVGEPNEAGVVMPCLLCHGTGTVPSEPKNPAESEVSEELLSESITSIPPQPAPEPKVSNSVGLDSPDDELRKILGEGDWKYTDKPHRISALYAARFERALGENSHTHDGAAGDEATWEAAQNQLRDEARTRYYQGDGNGQD